MKKYFVLLSICCSVEALANHASCLAAAYSAVEKVDEQTIQFANGQQMKIGEKSSLPFSQLLQNATLADQLSQRYPLTFSVPKQYQDAGRIRNELFFKHLYGFNQQEIKKNLVSVYWAPSKSSVQFNRNNGASEQLQKVGNEIAQYPDLISYVNKSLGSFHFRKIAGTTRLSTHSFGIAIDFQLPKPLHKYWRWDGCKSEDQPCPFPNVLMEDEKLKRIVMIFEKHGFIWGGKWASYDSVHFEYRPELLIAACR
ncbi:M15 family metallopeptidase [Frederiksenia canicola]|uniref:D-alanyl-D-alanine carboxypeptidase-like protein n=1 Tax=Frederiksenia canicola TaxID=123824 RepID=A0AAE6X8X8_9PAST|nr:M15 family metallopeptidase [Frederiksenia canicola]QIM65614.1 hypothetical protein A4G17_09245 [Frederiksenia canicola]RPE95929.1 D-alanyl-D-alanine carboxypeptidase-like protein [Frederiksenia canicola]